jgi:hypothetical protein
MAKDKVEKPEKAEKEEVAVVEIIRGRMPVAIAAVIKHGVSSELKDAEVAAMFRTTNGKIADLRADRNFAYVDEDFKPTKEQKALAMAYAEECEASNKIGKLIKALGVATEEEAVAADEARKGARKSPGKPKADKPKKEKAKVDDDDEELEEDDLEEDDLDDLLDD